jgi:gliding motility-associated-like protein
MVVLPSSVFIPNVFTPNNDGENDFFTFIGEGLVDVEMLIYDRWGNEVFVADNRERWDGSAEGGEAPEGVYVYVFKLTFADGTVQERTGTVTLLR